MERRHLLIGTGLAAALAAGIGYLSRNVEPPEEPAGLTETGLNRNAVLSTSTERAVDPPDPGISQSERDRVECLVYGDRPAVAHGKGVTVRLVAGANPDSKWLDGNVPQAGKALIVIYTREWDRFLPVRRPCASWEPFDEAELRSTFALGSEKVQNALNAELASPKPNPVKVAALRAKLARFEDRRKKFENASTREGKFIAMREGIVEATKERIWVPAETCFVEFARVAKERTGKEWALPEVGK